MDEIPKSRQRYLRRANLPIRYRDTNLADLSITDEVFTASNCLIERMISEDPPIGRGLLLYGRPGRGKSTIAVAALRQALLSVPRERLGHTVEGDAYRPGYYMSYAELIRTYHKSWRKDEDDCYDLLQALFHAESITYLNTRLLVLDDVGKEHNGPSGFTVAVLHDLLRSRYDKGAPTIITTNLAPEEFAPAYGEAMASFIWEAFDIVKVGGTDRRA